MNLLVNALEAMPNGGRFIFRVERQGDHVAVAAQDEGHGISERIRERIFAPFLRPRSATNRPRAFCRVGIVNRHGGTIEVESAPGRGSTFTLRLPVSQETSADRPSTTVAYAPKKRARVLVIEDEPDVRDVLKELLTAEGYVVIEARDGAEGVARCEVEPVDLVLTDILMPGMSGWDVAAACRDRFPTVPVALITAWGIS